ATWFQMEMSLTPDDVAQRYVEYALNVVR
ncbi:MAG: hypothetical protein QOD82_7575, partial [Pseudonocardiales bacterium]|nr:hypothetical protein [Pseudonocardiales bacterium]